jgi:hypothetical protein
MRRHDDRGAGPDADSGDDRSDIPDHRPTDGTGRGVQDSAGTSTDAGARGAEQRLLTGRAINEADLAVSEVWLRYFSFSGMVEEYEVHAYVQGLIDLPRLQRDLIAQAVNELIDELPHPRRAPSDADLDDTPDDTRDG